MCTRSPKSSPLEKLREQWGQGLRGTSWLCCLWRGRSFLVLPVMGPSTAPAQSLATFSVSAHFEHFTSTQVVCVWPLFPGRIMFRICPCTLRPVQDSDVTLPQLSLLLAGWPQALPTSSFMRETTMDSPLSLLCSVPPVPRGDSEPLNYPRAACALSPQGGPSVSPHSAQSLAQLGYPRPAGAPVCQ